MATSHLCAACFAVFANALEIYNGTGAPVNLATGGYNIQFFFNGSATTTLVITYAGAARPQHVARVHNRRHERMFLRADSRSARRACDR